MSAKHILRHSDRYLYIYYLNEGTPLRIYIVVVVFFDAIYMRKRKRVLYLRLSKP